jgi:hypothetical protein
MIKEIKCDYCNKVIKSKVDNRCKNHFCGSDCYRNFLEAKKYIFLICDHCKQKFKKQLKIYNQIKKKRDKFFCSYSCSSLFNYKKYISLCPNGEYLSRIFKKVSCEECGKEFEQKPHEINSKKFLFCNIKCRDEYYGKYGLGGTKNFQNNTFLEGAINTEEQAYTLGFFYADGNLSNFGFNKAVSLEIQRGDEKLLRKIASFFGKENSIGYRTRTSIVNKIDTPTCYFSIHGYRVWESFYNKGIKPRKSKTDDYPEVLNFIPYKLIHHFIRGVFDGDGCINLNGPSFGITGKKTMLKEILHIICKELGFSENKKIIIKKRDNEKHSETADMSIGGRRQVLLIREWLYKDAFIFMDRKKHKFYSIEMPEFTSKYIGVYKKGNKWVAQYSRKWIGSYATEDEAAKAYDKIAIEKGASSYRLNFCYETKYE